MAGKAKSTSATHERLIGKDDVKLGSDRSFGFVIAGVLALIAAIRLWHGENATYFLIGMLALAVPAAVWPRALRPLNLLWYRFGLLLHAVMTPLIMGLMFFTVITPIGWLMRILGKRPLALEFDPAARSYWIHRNPPGPAPDSLTNQF
jgi:hypothetical protein